MTKTSDASPIWYTRWPGDTGSMVYLRGAHAGGFQASLEFSRASRAFRPTDNSNAPDFLYFENAQGIQSSYKDAFMIVNGLLVVSKKF